MFKRTFHLKAFSLCLAVILLVSFSIFGTNVAAQEKPLGSKWKPLMIGSLLFYGFLPSWRMADILEEQKIFGAVYTFPSAVERLEAVAGGYSTCVLCRV